MANLNCFNSLLLQLIGGDVYTLRLKNSDVTNVVGVEGNGVRRTLTTASDALASLSFQPGALSIRDLCCAPVRFLRFSSSSTCARLYQAPVLFSRIVGFHTSGSLSWFVLPT